MIGKMLLRGAALALLFDLAACATTSEMPLAPNMVRLNTQASGLLFTSTAGQTTLRKAAEATLARGYTHFRLEQADTQTGSQLVGMSANTTGFGNGTVYGNGFSGTYNSTTTYMPMRAPTASIGVTVVMFHANEAGAKNAFNAAQVLKKNSQT